MQIQLPNGTVGFDESGRGQPLVFIHGYPFNRTMWQTQLAGLSDAARVLTFDLWGFGESAPPLKATTMATYADELHTLLDTRGITESVVVCGLSMGGYIASEFFRCYRTHVAGMILANTKAGPDSPEGQVGRDKSAALAKEKGAGAIAEAMLPKLLSPKTYAGNPALVARLGEMMARATVDGIVAALQAMRDRADSTPTLAEIETPALVIGGADDQLFPQSEFENLARGLKRGRLEILPNAGHVSNMEQPELFNRAVREFLQTLKL